LEEEMKKNLKAYGESLKNEKKGKGRIDPAMEKWIEKNTDRYMVGRTKPNPKLELGQWYILFTTLSLEGVPEHPCKFAPVFKFELIY